MKSFLTLMAASAIFIGSAAAPFIADATTQPAVAVGGSAASFDDPLPPGALARFGSARFRHGIPVSMLSVSETTHLAVAVNGNHMLGATRVFDLNTGRVLYALDGWEGTSIEAATFSPDGKTLVTKQEFSLRLRDATTGVESRKFDLPHPKGSYNQNEWVKFSPDGKLIAVTSQGDTVHLVDVASGKIVRELVNDNPDHADGWRELLCMAFSPDGKRLAAGGFSSEKDNYFARVWDVDTGAELHRLLHGRSYGIRAIAFSPDGKTIATGGGDSRLRTFDADTGELRRAFTKVGNNIETRSIAFAPDGATIAAGMSDALRVYDATSGEERWHLDRKAIGLQFTDGGKSLTGAVAGTIYRWDAATGKPLTPEGGDSAIDRILATGDGRRVVTLGADGDAHLWDAATGEHLRYLRAAWQKGIALSPDGKFLAWPVRDTTINYTDPNEPRSRFDGNRIVVYDIDADKMVDRFTGFKGDANHLAFTSDGQRLITVDFRNGMVRVWDFASGKEARSFQAVPEDEAKMVLMGWRADVSPNGKTVAFAYVNRGPRSGVTRMGDGESHLIRVWDLATGKELRLINSSDGYPRSVSLSPDGRWIVGSGSAFDNLGATRPLTVWNVLNGKAAGAVPAGACAAQFSGDGRYLATARPDGVVQVWETASWTLRNEFNGPKARPSALSFAPNRPVLYSGGFDTTALAWDLSIPRVASTASLDAAWNGLSAPDARESLKAQSQFLAAPADAIKLLTDKIKPATPPDVKQIQGLINDLDGASFDAREAATKSLVALGAAAAPQLEKASAATSSPEVRERIIAILSVDAAVSPDQLRQTRAVAILEQLANADAKTLLSAWAGGQPGDVLTVQAVAALARLGATADAKR